VVLAVARNGWHGKRHLVAVLREERERQKRQDYIATVLWSIGRLVGGDGYPMPEFSEYMEQRKKDIRSAETIVTGLIERLAERGETEHA